MRELEIATSNILRSVERFQFNDRSTVIVADPERHGGRAVLDEYPAHIGLSWKQIFDRGYGGGIKTQNAIARHRAAPQVAVSIQEGVIRIGVRRRHVPFLESLLLDIE